MSYFARISTRDGEGTIAECLGSILKQTIQPRMIIVVNDGSTDRTGEIIADFQEGHPHLIKVINTGSKTRDYTRLPHLLNISIAYAREMGLNTDYIFSTGGDCRFAPDYVAKVIAAMEQDKSIVIASGDFEGMQASAPQGSGRVIRQSFFREHYPNGFFEMLGYESEIMERAIFTGHRLKVVSDARFEHLDRLGHDHNFKEWGYGMKCLGYYPPYALARVVWDFCNNRTVGKKGAIQMLYHYLVFTPEQSGYYARFPADLCDALRERQKNAIKSILTEKFGIVRLRMIKNRVLRA